MTALFAGGLTFIGYILALIIGGETATNICTWIYNSFVPVMIYTTTIMILFGLVTMYLAGEKGTDTRTLYREDRERNKRLSRYVLCIYGN